MFYPADDLMVLMEQGRAVCVVLAEIFSDVVCMYVAIKQNIVRSEIFLEKYGRSKFFMSLKPITSAVPSAMSE